MGREPCLPPPSATAHGIQFCAPTDRVTVIAQVVKITAGPRAVSNLMRPSGHGGPAGNRRAQGRGMIWPCASR